jgi:predicted DNA-binding ribbon-helix-helix protein
MTMLIEQESSSRKARQASGGHRTSRRLPFWSQVDLFAQTDVSVVRQLAAWLALSITLAVAVLLLVGP